MTERLKEFLQQKRWLQLKKRTGSQLLLLGCFFLWWQCLPVEQVYIWRKIKRGHRTGENGTEIRKEDYAEYLEHKLEQVLGQMEGVGKVSVMVTVADQGEDIIERIRQSIRPPSQIRTAGVWR